jgi:hypothetical protein
MLSAAGVFWALPEPLSLGPGWLLFAVILVLMIPIVITNSRGYFKITRMLTFTALALITVAMIASLIFLIQGIPSHREMPKALLWPKRLHHFWEEKGAVASTILSTNVQSGVAEVSNV